jgi:hypothetical protein
MWLKAILLLLVGCTAVAILLLRHPELETAALSIIAIWSFSRVYYFAFYVIERYIDPSFRFSGLGAFMLYVVKARRNRNP